MQVSGHAGHDVRWVGSRAKLWDTFAVFVKEFAIRLQILADLCPVVRQTYWEHEFEFVVAYYVYPQ